MKITCSSLHLVFAALLSFTLPQLAKGQESVPLEQAQKGAQLLTDAAGRLADAPVAIDTNLDKPFAAKQDDVGLLVIPDKALTAEKLSSATTTITPVGQLWMKEVSVAVNGHSPSKDDVRSYTVRAGDNDLTVQLYLVGVVKNAAGQAEVVVYGKGKEPLVHTSLDKSTTGSREMPIELTGKKNDEKSGTLTLLLPGNYQADIVLVKAE
jgi:hypothetical protein